MVQGCEKAIAKTRVYQGGLKLHQLKGSKKAQPGTGALRYKSGWEDDFGPLEGPLKDLGQIL